MGLRNSVLGRPESPVQKAAVDAMCELTGYRAADRMGSLSRDRIEVKKDGLHVLSCSGLASSPDLEGRSNAIRQSLTDAGLEIEVKDIVVDRLVTGVETAEVVVSAERNGGFSGIADKINAHLGKAPDAQSHIQQQRDRDAAGGKGGGAALGGD